MTPIAEENVHKIDAAGGTVACGTDQSTGAATQRELELLIGGIADIDVDDWKKHTDYRGYTEQDEVIQYFWKCVRTWDAEQKSRLLQFTTGTSRIPVNGFKDLQGSDGPRRFTIEKSGEVNQLPKSHTWLVFSVFLQISTSLYSPLLFSMSNNNVFH